MINNIKALVVSIYVFLVIIITTHFRGVDILHPNKETGWWYGIAFLVSLFTYHKCLDD